MRFAATFVLSVLLLWSGRPAHAQLNQPDRIRLGTSIGTGGVHGYFKPSFDFHWKGTSLRLAPGPWYASAELSQRIGYFRNRRRSKRPIILHAIYHEDYFLSNNKNVFRSGEAGTVRDQDIGMLIVGTRYDLEHLGRVYIEVGVGAMYLHEQYFAAEAGPVPDANKVYPMLELRVGGIFQFHRERVQQTPKKPKKSWWDKLFKKKKEFEWEPKDRGKDGRPDSWPDTEIEESDPARPLPKPEGGKPAGADSSRQGGSPDAAPDEAPDSTEEEGADDNNNLDDLDDLDDFDGFGEETGEEEGGGPVEEDGGDSLDDLDDLDDF